jgi:hypothetical protein
MAIPAFYFFIRRYFDKWTALGLLAVFSTSLYLVMYSRFAWNPNPVPFFILATFYCLLRAVDKEEKKSGLWLILSALFLAITTQLHFLAFLAIPAAVALFLVIKRPRIKFKYWAAAILVILFFYAPVIINDIKTGGANEVEFMKAISGKSGKDKKTFLAKGIENLTAESSGYFLILSGQGETELAKLKQTGPVTFNVTCDLGCRHNLPLGITAIVLFVSGFALMFYTLYKERESKRRDFLILNSLWFIMSFGLFTPIAYDISPRFFLIVAGLPFVFLGISYEFAKNLMEKKFGIGKVIMIAFSAFVALLVFSNAQKTSARFQELAKAPIEEFKPEPDRILKEKHRVTLLQEETIVDYIFAKHKENNYPVYLNSDPQYRRSFLYLIDSYSIPRDDLRNSINDGKVYEHGNYFLIYPTVSNTDTELKNYMEKFSVSDKKKFGTLTLYVLKPKPEAITDVEQNFNDEDNNSNVSSVAKRFNWGELLDADEESIQVD